jgi:hypothetical protein
MAQRDCSVRKFNIGNVGTFDGLGWTVNNFGAL